MVASSLYNLIRPVDDAAEFFDIGIAEFHQFLGGDLASSAATAIDENQRVLIGQFLFGAVGDLVFGDEDRAFNMPFGEFFGGALMFAGGLIFGGKFGATDGASLAVLAYICAASIAANLIWNTLIKYNNISTLAVLKSADPLFASIFSGLLLGENILNRQFLFALILICSAIVLSNFKRKN